MITRWLPLDSKWINWWFYQKNQWINVLLNSKLQQNFKITLNSVKTSKLSAQRYQSQQEISKVQINISLNNSHSASRSRNLRKFSKILKKHKRSIIIFVRMDEFRFNILCRKWFYEETFFFRWIKYGVYEQNNK